MLELDFRDTPEKSKGEYLDMYEGIQTEVISTTRFDENSDLCTTYLGRIDTTRASKIEAEVKFPVSEQGYIMESYWMKQNVRYYWTQEKTNHSCVNHIIYNANLYICYQNLPLKCREFKQEMDNLLVNYSLYQ